MSTEAQNIAIRLPRKQTKSWAKQNLLNKIFQKVDSLIRGYKLSL